MAFSRNPSASLHTSPSVERVRLLVSGFHLPVVSRVVNFGDPVNCIFAAHYVSVSHYDSSVFFSLSRSVAEPNFSLLVLLCDFSFAFP